MSQNDTAAANHACVNTAEKAPVDGIVFDSGPARMKLVIVDRSRTATFARLTELFARDPGVVVIWDRRANDERRHGTISPAGERRVRERRQSMRVFDARGFIVVDSTDAPQAI